MRLLAAATGLWLLLLPCAAFAVDAENEVGAKFDYDWLRLRFAQPMQTWQNAREGIVRLAPALATSCYWENDTNLLCTFDDANAPAKATGYRIHLDQGLKTQAGKLLPERILEAETARPALSAEIAGWTAGRPNIVVTSSLRAAADDIATALRLYIDGKQMQPAVHPSPGRGAWDEGRRYALVLPEIADREATLTLGVKPGLVTSEGPLRGTQDASLLGAIVNERFQVRGAVCAGRAKAVSGAPADGELRLDCTPGEAVRLLFSQPLQDAARDAWIGSWPTMAKWQRNGMEESWRARTRKDGKPRRAPAAWVEFQMEGANIDMALPIPASLRNRDGDATLAPVLLRVRTGNYRPALRASHARMLITDGDALPVLADAINATPVPIEVHGVGARPRRETVDAPGQRSNQPIAIASEVSAQVLGEGGWVNWSPETGKAESRAPLQFAAPAFDLFAVASRRQVLAWANGWDDGHPVADAAVELLWLDAADATPRVIARGSTQADGTVLLALPETLVIEGKPSSSVYPMWLLRAAGSRRAHAPRAVLPLGSTQAWGTQLGRVVDQKLWGVADRPLYRAGETVRYHLWVRDVSGGRLSRPRRISDVALRLSRGGYEETILGWSTTPDAGGGISGELVLPVHLPDDTYCIGAGQNYELEGSCFHVGTYRAQDLWAEAGMPDHVLRDGDRLQFDITAGYYSGGPAAGVPIGPVTALLEGLPLGQAYPLYSDYHFADTSTRWGAPIRVAGAEDLKLVANADGRARGDLPVAFDERDLAEGGKLPAFGRLRLTAEVKLSDRESTVASAVSARYSRFRQFIGLRLQPAWLDATTPVSMEGIVIDAEGHEVADAAIQVEVHYLPGFDDDDDDEQEPAAPAIRHCLLRSKRLSDCTFPRAKSGRYRIVARSGDAAPAELTQRVWVPGDSWRADDQRTELEMVQAPPKRGDKARVLLRQSSERAQALFVFIADDRILGHRVAPVVGKAQSFELETSTDWPREVHVRAYVRADGNATPSQPGLRTPARVTNDDVELTWSETRHEHAPVALSFDATVTKPGETIRILLRNDSNDPRNVVLAVVDDALRTLAHDQLPHFDPHGEYWLGSLGGYPRVSVASFGDWNDQAWRWWLSWPGDATASGSNAPRDCSTMQGVAEVAACEAANAADAAASIGQVQVGRGAVNPIDVSSVESTTILATEQVAQIPADRDVTSVALLAPGTVRAPPPPPGEPPAVFDDPTSADAAAAPAQSTSLDTVTVVGSGAIDPAGIFDEAKPRASGLRPREERHALRASARVRTQFADTALWLPNLQLAPGESRSVDLKVPDNLTRWRAVAWSSDADDGFAMAEATLEVGLPVEVRLQTPVRIYPGDRARLAANVRQAGESATQATVEMRVEGGDGGDAALDHAQALPLPARGQDSFGAEIAPQRTGALRVTAMAHTPAGLDAVATPIEVASPTINSRKIQVGWLGDAPMQLDLPALPAGASNARLQLSVLRGGAGLVERWTNDLREYQHRCWEQILSRAVAAALAIERGMTAEWPDAAVVVQEALDNAAVFQNDEGDFRYFTETSTIVDHGADPPVQVALTGYTVEAFALLRQLGHPVPVAIADKARAYLAHFVPDEEEQGGADERAFAMAASGSNTADRLDGLWKRWSDLSLPARIAATRALAQAGHDKAVPAATQLLEEAPLRGSARVLALPRGLDRWMSSELREQCALIDLLRDHPQLAPAHARQTLIAGLADLYSGGIQAVDTQAGAVCLMALRESGKASDSAMSVDVRIGSHARKLVLPAGQDRVDWQLEAPSARTLLLTREPDGEGPASFVAQLDYREDARQARSSAVGLALDRRHAVLRDGQWRSVEGNALREGDWVRVTLVVSTGAPRYFVAVTDDLPGGFRPTDLSLSSVAGLDMEAVSHPGSHWFQTRKLDPRSPRFYAEYLPAGRHEIHYFARIGNSGDYLAAPALAELMYGSATRARTGSTRLQMEEAAKPAP